MTKREVDSEPDKAEAEHSGTLAVTGETDTAPATASEGKGESALPTVSGAGAGRVEQLARAPGRASERRERPRRYEQSAQADARAALPPWPGSRRVT